MKDKILVCNYKSNIVDLENYFKKIDSKGLNLIICPSFLQISELAHYTFKGVIIGAQNCAISKETLTGEINAGMLLLNGVQYCLVGHSERRKNGETNEDIKQKIKELQSELIVPILCVGETEKLDIESAFDIVKNQIEQSEILDSDAEFIIAYEPVFSIGTGEIPSFKHIEEMCAKIKKLYPCKVLYGGSFNEDNCESIMQIKSVDGALIGGASLKVEKMNKICELVSNLKLNYK